MTDTNEDQLEWRSKSPDVRRALQFIKRRGTVTAAELVEWDRTHGRKLFDWNDTSAANYGREEQARAFLRNFRVMFENKRVRGFIHVNPDEKHGIDEGGYVTVETVSAHRGMREQVVADIMRRIESLTAELRLWKLTPAEREQFFERLAGVLKKEAA